MVGFFKKTQHSRLAPGLSRCAKLFLDGEGLSEGQAFPLPSATKKLRLTGFGLALARSFRTEPGHRFMGHCNGASLQWSRVPGFAPSSTPSRLAPLGVQCVEASLYCTSVTQTQPGGRIGVVQVVKVSPRCAPDVQVCV